jgi:NAD(P)-dependent dehydrogenase (short-subunit alcohol dehydrogenase family)
MSLRFSFSFDENARYAGMNSISTPSEQKFLAGKIAIVTGASRGIGRAIAVKLAREGAQVMLTARNEALLETAAAEIVQAGGHAEFRSFDLREPAAAAHLVEATLQGFGALDIVINNAGATKRGEFLTLTEEDWTDGFALKFFGAVRLTRAAWPFLKEHQGSVMFIAGIGGRTPGAEFSIGGSVNAALLSLTKALADLGVRDGVQVNAVNPGRVKTERLQKRIEARAKELGIGFENAAEEMIQSAGITRFGEPEEVAELVAFIVSSKGRWLHGSLIDQDGGETKAI